MLLPFPGLRVPSLQIKDIVESFHRNKIACALSARIWEDIVKQHRVPCLILRVDDMRMTFRLLA